MAKVFLTFSYNQAQQKELDVVGLPSFALKEREREKIIFTHFIILAK